MKRLGKKSARATEHDLDLRTTRLRAERDVLEKAILRSNGTLSRAAKLLGISRPTLYQLMKTHGQLLPAVADAVLNADAESIQSETCNLPARRYRAVLASTVLLGERECQPFAFLLFEDMALEEQ
jgi:hypothetical protein